MARYIHSICFNCESRESGAIIEVDKDGYCVSCGTKVIQERRESVTNETMKWEFCIAGVQHHKMYTCINKLKVGQHLPLTREPTNKYDPCAVQISYATNSDEVMLGYVPQKISPQVSAAIVDENLTISCKILEVNPEEKPWRQCKVVIERRSKNV